MASNPPTEQQAGSPDGKRSLERRRQVRGLLWLAAWVLVFSLLRAGATNVFPVRWWHPW